MAMVLLALAWVGWCGLHSLLISPKLGRRLQDGMGARGRYFRLVYNLTALVTLAPLLLATARLQGPEIYRWQGGWTVLRLVLLVCAIALFIGGARCYDLGYFLGVRQIREGRGHLLLSEDGGFCRTGVFSITRHPWYLGSLLLLWSALTVYHLGSVVAAAILSLYLVAGTWLEERKLIAECGESYLRYQEQVSMLLPWKWLRGRRRPGS